MLHYIVIKQVDTPRDDHVILCPTFEFCSSFKSGFSSIFFFWVSSCLNIKPFEIRGSTLYRNLTSSIEQIPPREPSPTTRETPRLFMEEEGLLSRWKEHPTLAVLMSQMKPVDSLPSILFKVHFNTTVQPTHRFSKRSVTFKFPTNVRRLIPFQPFNCNSSPKIYRPCIE
jgi:hypothetical protein